MRIPENASINLEQLFDLCYRPHDLYTVILNECIKQFENDARDRSKPDEEQSDCSNYLHILKKCCYIHGEKEFLSIISDI